MSHTTENKALFTKGDWTTTTVNNPDYVDIDSPNGRIVSVLLNDITKEQGEPEANARLIAASKDLYFVLKDILEWGKTKDGKFTFVTSSQQAQQWKEILNKAIGK